MENSSTTREGLKRLFTPRQSVTAPRPFPRPLHHSKRVSAVANADAFNDNCSLSTTKFSGMVTEVKGVAADSPNPYPLKSATGEPVTIRDRWLPGPTNEDTLEHDGRTSHSTMVYDGIGFHTAVLGRELPGIRDNRHLWEKGIG